MLQPSKAKQAAAERRERREREQAEAAAAAAANAMDVNTGEQVAPGPGIFNGLTEVVAAYQTETAARIKRLEDRIQQLERENRELKKENTELRAHLSEAADVQQIKADRLAIAEKDHFRLTSCERAMQRISNIVGTLKAELAGSEGIVNGTEGMRRMKRKFDGLSVDGHGKRETQRARVDDGYQYFATGPQVKVEPRSDGAEEGSLNDAISLVGGCLSMSR
ncbi:hypothetical protein V8F20_006043 [Naviculisporaceae sp. PSN 640]